MHQYNLLLVDDDPGMIQLMGRCLAGLGRLRFATSGEQALRQMRDTPPDLVLLDGEMPGLTGFQVCEHMKADTDLAGIPVIFVTGHSDTVHELQGLELGAVDFIAKPISEPLLVARVKTQLRIKRLTDELRNIARTDALTELANRRAFDEALEREWRRARRDGEPISLLLVDVDHFKRFNDHYGHPMGDACLHQVAQALKTATMRPADCVARFGGEEFALLLPHTAQAGASAVARRVIENVLALALPHEASPTAPWVSVSIGLGTFDEQSPSWSEQRGETLAGSLGGHMRADLIKAADLALYAAKGAGRAQAWALSIDDIETPAMAKPIESGALQMAAPELR